jgi:RNA recognition motif-containing protein
MSLPYFGQFGKVVYVVFDHKTSEKNDVFLNGMKCAFITFLEDNDAAEALKAVNETYLNGFFIKFHLLF